ncbi:MAG: hypothetical protein QNK33_10365, partial [Bacteroidales bacterium]|nr:hypothetical protein [Bacteroidales bacterium]
KSKDFEAVTSPEANIVCFRYTVADNKEEANSLNKRIRETIIKKGNFYIVQAELCGLVWLRVTLINPLTDLSLLEELLEEIRVKALTV